MSYNKTIEEVQKSINTTKSGLTTAEAEARLLKNGKNLIQEGKRASAITRFARQFRNILILVLVGAMLLSIALAILNWDGDKLIDAFLIGVIVFINAYLGFAQESKAEKAVANLKKVMQPYAKVIRDGEVVKVKTYELVLGDIVLLEAGDIVPADIRLTEAASLMIEEASLTGESVPSEKSTGAIECCGSVALGDQKNMAFMSGIVTYGRGRGIVVATGMDTQLGLIATHLNEQKQPETPLTKRLHKTSKIIAIVMLFLSAGIFISRWLTGDAVTDSIMITIAIAVCAIPEGLPACVTITMSLGVQRMSKKKAIIRNLPAVETLGSTEIICSDKTGTLTLNKMTVQSFWIKSGNETHVACKSNIEQIDALNENENFKRLMRCMLLCNDSKLRYENGQLTTLGDPTETALVHCAHIFNKCKEYADLKWQRLCEIPFDSERKLMSTLHKEKDATVMYTKGALDNLIGRCTKILDNGKVRDLTEADIAHVNATATTFAKDALRVLGYAYKPMTTDKLTPTDENDLILIGFTGMIDPPREEVFGAIAECKAAGIATVMITGDHRDTAFAIAKQIGMAESEDEVITGVELDALTEEEFNASINKYRVYARVNPEHKVRIVAAFQAQNKVVAMTGDGVNDAASIKAADIGIGMGITGTDVTKGVADVILTDDNFATIVSAVKEGRRTFDNIKKIFVYLLALHLAEVLLLTGILIIFDLPFFSPLLILWINVITNTVPAIALGALPPSPGIMKRRPQNSRGSLFRGRTGEEILVYAAYQVVLVLIVYLVAMFGFGFEPIVAITMSYLVLGTIEAIHAYNLYHNRESLFKANAFNNKFLHFAVIFSALLVVGSIALPIPFLQNALGITQLTWVQWAIALGAGFAIMPLAELYKFVRSRIDKRKSVA